MSDGKQQRTKSHPSPSILSRRQPASSSAPPAPGSKKTDAQVKAEIAAIIKQITASCTFLPVIEEECAFASQRGARKTIAHVLCLLLSLLTRSGAFQILAYTNSQLSEPVPLEWQDSDARLIAEGQAEQVKLRSFSTAIHKVDAVVAYRRGEEDE